MDADNNLPLFKNVIFQYEDENIENVKISTFLIGFTALVRINVLEKTWGNGERQVD